MDTMTPERRSALMSRIRSTGTAPERALIRMAESAGRRFRPNDASLPGKPDLAFHGARLAVFAHGCFWHGHSCRGQRAPKSNEEFWRAKFDANKRRDRRAAKALRAMGWPRGRRPRSGF
jgi:DNA mismatch endonuclease, patch repair protein